MKSTLIDAGPLIALFNRKDSYHNRAVAYIRDYRGLLFSTWPVITEADHMLSFNAAARIGLLEWIKRKGLKIFKLSENHLTRIIHIMEKYSDIPMDLADASLIMASEDLGIREIISIDSDFDIYRTLKKDYVKNVFY